MTKLKKPITITIQTVECAVMLKEIILTPMSLFSERIRRLASLCQVTDGTGIGSQVVDQLTAQGIDYRTWEPPQPLKIASHEVTASPDGSIKVGCTAVTRAELEAAYKLSTGAMQQEPEWPKWWADRYDSTVFLADSPEDLGTYCYRDGRRIKSGSEPAMAIHAEKQGYKPLTPLEAQAILGGK